MRDRMERFVVLPFTIGCVSDSSVAVSSQPKRQATSPADDPPPRPPSLILTRTKRVEEGEEGGKGLKMKNSWGLIPLPKPPRVSLSLNRLIKTLKSFSHLFVYKEEIEEMEMEIGFPTDVKHVSHIGLDGSTTTSSNTLMKDWENHKPTQAELFAFSAISLRQFELAMAAQADNTATSC